MDDKRFPHKSTDKRNPREKSKKEQEKAGLRDSTQDEERRR